MFRAARAQVLGAFAQFVPRLSQPSVRFRLGLLKVWTSTDDAGPAVTELVRHHNVMHLEVFQAVAEYFDELHAVEIPQ